MFEDKTCTEDKEDKSSIENEEFRISLQVKETEGRYQTKILPQIYVSDESGSKKILRNPVEQQNKEMKVKKGETVVVGGMFKDITVKSIKKIPFLSEIPLLGFAFRMHKEQLRNTEIIIFLTTEIKKKN